ncbi:hypothetical protein D3C72_2100970 [compost metagenome]
MRDQTGTDMAAGQGQAVDSRAKVKAMLVLVQPPFRQQALDKTVNRTLCCSQRPDQFGEGHARVVHHFLKDLRHAIHRAVVLRVRF